MVIHELLGGTKQNAGDMGGGGFGFTLFFFFFFFLLSMHKVIMMDSHLRWEKTC